MDLNETLSELRVLPVADRLRVVESLWDSLDAEPAPVLAPEQQAELDRRLQRHEERPHELLTWKQVADRLRDR